MEMTGNKRIWLTWETQRRNSTLSRQMDAQLYEVVFHGTRLVRYYQSAVRTAGIVSRTRPAIVFVQNPSMVLCLLAVILRSIYRYKLVVDAHNAGLFPCEGKSRLLNILARFIAVSADNVFVTNPSLERIVCSWGAKPLVLPDPLPELTPRCRFPWKQAPFRIVFVCGWAHDEPYEEVLVAASLLDTNFRISITGNHNGKTARLSVPENVVLTGFLSKEDYIDVLYDADAVMVLTTRDNCLNCGAYEGVSAEKPLILSDSWELRNYFNKGVVFTRNEAVAIAASVKQVRESIESLHADIIDLKQELTQSWNIQKARVETVIAAK